MKDKEEFLRRKKGVRNQADVVAQQLINIYRQLSILGEGATERYNKQLLEQVNPDVLSSFKTIPGGEEVRDYYHFLTRTAEEDEEVRISDDNLDKLLPKSEEISPIWLSYQMPQQATPLIASGNFMVGDTTQKTPVNEEIKPIQEKEVSVVTKTIQVRVGFDEQKVKEQLNELFKKQRIILKRAFDSIIIDSNIDVMNENLNRVSKEVTDSFDDMASELENVLNSSKIDEPPTVVSETEEVKKKPISAAAIKNVRKKSEHKFSVDMSEE